MRAAPRSGHALLAALALGLVACPESPGMAPVPGSGFLGAPFAQADLAADWRYAVIFHGPGVAAGTTRGWERGRLRIAADGKATVLAWSATDASPWPSAPLGWPLDVDGNVTAPSSDTSGFHVKLSGSRTLAAGTATAFGSAAALWVLVRSPMLPTFSAADLAGSSWTYHRLVTGAAPSWEHGVASVDAAGIVSFGRRVASAGAQADQPAVGTLAVDSGGGVTLDADASFLGALSIDKNVIVATRTVSAGSLFALEVWSRLGQSFARSDLAGPYASHALVAGPGGAWGWSRGVSQVDDAGERLTWLSSLTNAGVTTLPPPSIIFLDPDGTVTTLDPSLHSTALYSREGSVRTVTNATYASLGVNFR